MVEAGIIHARGGKVRLIRRGEVPEGWRPSEDSRLAVWELTQHLVYGLEIGGEQAAVILLENARGLGDAARDLAYRLYTTCERKKWAQEALAYNSLVIAWPEIAKLAVQRIDEGGSVQKELDL